MTRTRLFLVVGLLMCAAATVVLADDQPSVAKDSIRLSTQIYSGKYDTPAAFVGWKPYIEFRVNGPVASGSQLSVEFGYPGKPQWVKFDCQTHEVEAGQSFATECGAPNEQKWISPYSGPVDFSIRLR